MAIFITLFLVLSLIISVVAFCMEYLGIPRAHYLLVE